jgi:hypothetical protein
MQVAGLSALTNSGLFQTLLEGVLLLLGVDPAAFPQDPESQQHAWDSLKIAHQAGACLALTLAAR